MSIREEPALHMNVQAQVRSTSVRSRSSVLDGSPLVEQIPREHAVFSAF